MSSILRELAEVQHQLVSLSKDAEAQKYALLARQEELHTRAARLAEQIDEECSTQDLLARLAELRWQLRALNRQRVDTGGRPMVRTQGASRPTVGQASSSRIEARIQRILALLAKRGIDVR
ncbi:MAG: hypothetical protein QNJ77_09350 [Acidimicrobiia bacterium]|nr:hypothetical protein [Acidimicrobiia bacterium]MDJ0924757.1 hypothetical protein [Acidimicrobiia bacterium]